MMHLLRRLMKSLIFKIVLFGLLLVSFGLWGITDTLTGGHLGRNEIARAGDVTLSLQDYQRDYNQRYQRLSEAGLTAEQIEGYNLPQIVLELQVNRLSLLAESESLGLQAAQSEIQQQILQQDVFHGPDGTFSALVMERLLRLNGFTVKQYYELVAQDLRLAALREAVLTAPPLPEAAIVESYRFTRETRDVDYVSLAIDSVEIDEDPTEETLKSYYEQHKARFTISEQREIRYITQSLDAFAQQITPSQDEIAVYYQDNLAEFSEPEQRSYRLIRFSDAESAQEFSQKLQNGSDFDALAAQENSSIIDNDLRKRDEIPDEALRDAVFTVSKDNPYSAPVEGQIGHYIVALKQIQPQKQPALEEIRDEISKKLAEETSIDSYFTLLSRAEDLSIAGSGLDEIAESLSLPIYAAGAVTISGRRADGSTPPGPRLPPTAMQQAFTLQLNETSYIIENEQEFYLLHIDNITPAAVSDYAEIAADVIQSWQREQKQQIARSKIENLQKMIKESGKNLHETAKTLGFTVQQQAGFDRFSTHWPPYVTQKIFTATKPEQLLREENPSRIWLFLVTKITALPHDIDKNDTQYQEFAGNFRTQYSQTMEELYRSALRQKHDVTVNRDLVEQFTQQISGSSP